MRALDCFSVMWHSRQMSMSAEGKEERGPVWRSGDREEMGGMTRAGIRGEILMRCVECQMRTHGQAQHAPVEPLHQPCDLLLLLSVILPVPDLPWPWCRSQLVVVVVMFIFLLLLFSIIVVVISVVFSISCIIVIVILIHTPPLFFLLIFLLLIVVSFRCQPHHRRSAAMRALA